jgi:hypothetical protein
MCPANESPLTPPVNPQRDVMGGKTRGVEGASHNWG